jgi:hypothetical protein
MSNAKRRRQRSLLCVFFIAFLAFASCGLGQDSPKTGIRPRQYEKPPDATELYQNEPNPASDYTVIYFYLAQSGPVSLKLYSLSGRLIGYFIDGFQQSGWYSVAFHTDFLAKGEFIYRLHTPATTSIKKMLVTR